ncbi:MAG: phosphotransferase [Ilumatobacteraceae bacterium]
MQPIGPKIAEGRDSEIYEHGPGKVLRLAREPRSMVAEGEIMSYARSMGFPAPAVHDAGDGFLVMDRVEGPSMLEDAIPFRIRPHARLLADLHEQLHRLPAPAWLTRGTSLPGDRLLHRDLHPLNVLIGRNGPVVIDWANASRGDPAYDVADAWVLFSCADPPMRRVEVLVAPLVRKVFLRSFLGRLDRAAARRAIPAVVADRLADPNMTDRERERMRALADWAERSEQCRRRRTGCRGG